MYFIYKAPSCATKACNYRLVATVASFEKAKERIREEKMIDKAVNRNRNSRYPIYYVWDSVNYKEV